MEGLRARDEQLSKDNDALDTRISRYRTLLGDADRQVGVPSLLCFD